MGFFENVAAMVAVGVNDDSHGEIVGARVESYRVDQVLAWVSVRIERSWAFRHKTIHGQQGSCHNS